MSGDLTGLCLYIILGHENQQTKEGLPRVLYNVKQLVLLIK